jgi:hypothetical protein
MCETQGNLAIVEAPNSKRQRATTLCGESAEMGRPCRAILAALCFNHHLQYRLGASQGDSMLAASLRNRDPII